MKNFLRSPWSGHSTSRDSVHDYEQLPLSLPTRQDSPDLQDGDIAEKSTPSIPSGRAAWLWRLAPFFIAGPLGKTTRRLPKSNSTIYLNGIRALACWIVLNFHTSMEPWREQLAPGWGNTEPKNMATTHWLTLPIVRILYSGQGMVNVFFVLSGFVLSYSSMRRIHSGASQAGGNHKPETIDAILTSIASSALRRGIRLWGPMVAIWTITFTTSWFFPERTDPPLAATFPAHLWHWWIQLCKVTNPYNWVQREQFPHWFGQCWTLGVEYRLSMVLFLIILVTCKLTTLARKSVALLVAAWSMYIGRRWDIVCVLGGFVIAEFRFAPLSSDVARLFGRRTLQIPQIVQTVLFTVLLLAGMFLVSFPTFDPWRVWPYKGLTWITPQTWLHPGPEAQEPGSSYVWYYATYGSICFIYALDNLPLLQRALSNKVFIYLGEISFSFYIMAEFCRFRIAEPVAFTLMDQYGWSKLGSWWVEYFTAHGLAFVIGDYFWRIIDVNCVRLGHLVVTDFLGVGKSDRSSSQPVQLPVDEVEVGVEHVLPR